MNRMMATCLPDSRFIADTLIFFDRNYRSFLSLFFFCLRMLYSTPVDTCTTRLRFPELCTIPHLKVFE